jgi:hypothetical protein
VPTGAATAAGANVKLRVPLHEDCSIVSHVARRPDGEPVLVTQSLGNALLRHELLEAFVRLALALFGPAALPPSAVTTSKLGQTGLHPKPALSAAVKAPGVPQAVPGRVAASPRTVPTPAVVAPASARGRAAASAGAGPSKRLAVPSLAAAAEGDSTADTDSGSADGGTGRERSLHAGVVRAVQQAVEECLVPSAAVLLSIPPAHIDDPYPNLFRRSRLYTPAVNAVLVRWQPVTKALFARHRSEGVEFISLPSWQALLSSAGAFDGGLHRRVQPPPAPLSSRGRRATFTPAAPLMSPPSARGPARSSLVAASARGGGSFILPRDPLSSPLSARTLTATTSFRVPQPTAAGGPAGSAPRVPPSPSTTVSATTGAGAGARGGSSVSSSDLSRASGSTALITAAGKGRAGASGAGGGAAGAGLRIRYPEFGERDGRLLFLYSIMTVVDEVHRAAKLARIGTHTALTYVGFLEALCRLADSHACPADLPYSLLHPGGAPAGAPAGGSPSAVAPDGLRSPGGRRAVSNASSAAAAAGQGSPPMSARLVARPPGAQGARASPLPGSAGPDPASRQRSGSASSNASSGSRATSAAGDLSSPLTGRSAGRGANWRRGPPNSLHRKGGGSLVPVDEDAATQMDSTASLHAAASSASGRQTSPGNVVGVASGSVASGSDEKPVPGAGAHDRDLVRSGRASVSAPHEDAADASRGQHSTARAAGSTARGLAQGPLTPSPPSARKPVAIGGRAAAGAASRHGVAGGAASARSHGSGVTAPEHSHLAPVAPGAAEASMVDASTGKLPRRVVRAGGALVRKAGVGVTTTAGSADAVSSSNGRSSNDGTATSAEAQATPGPEPIAPGTADVYVDAEPRVSSPRSLAPSAVANGQPGNHPTAPGAAAAFGTSASTPARTASARRSESSHAVPQLALSRLSLSGSAAGRGTTEGDLAPEPSHADPELGFSASARTTASGASLHSGAVSDTASVGLRALGPGVAGSAGAVSTRQKATHNQRAGVQLKIAGPGSARGSAASATTGVVATPSPPPGSHAIAVKRPSHALSIRTGPAVDSVGLGVSVAAASSHSAGAGSASIGAAGKVADGANAGVLAAAAPPPPADLPSRLEIMLTHLALVEGLHAQLRSIERIAWRPSDSAATGTTALPQP